MSRANCLAVLCALAAPAFADPDSDPTAGRAVFTGATMPSATSIVLNPAALGLGTVDEIYAAAMALIDHDGIALATQDVNGNLTPGARVADTELGPGAMIAFVAHLKDRGTLAFELLAAPPQLFPSGQTALEYHTLGGGQRTYSVTVGGSVRVTDEIHVGLSLAAQRTGLQLKYARDTALAAGHGANGVDSDCGGAPCGIGNPQATEVYDVNVHSDLFSQDALTANIGILIALAKDMYLGASFHSPPGLAIQNELQGTMDVTRAPRDGGNLIDGDATVYISQPASVDAEFRMRLPADLDLHVGGRWEDLSRLQLYDVRGSSSVFPSSGIPEITERPLGFHDPFSLWAGVEQVDTKAGERWRFGGRIGIETSAVDSNLTSPLTIAPTSYTADFGAQLRVSPTLIFQLSYGLQWFPTVNVTSSAYNPQDQIDCIANGYDYTTAACAAVRNGYAIASAAGTYDRIEQAVRFGIRYELP